MFRKVSRKMVSTKPGLTQYELSSSNGRKNKYSQIGSLSHVYVMTFSAGVQIPDQNLRILVWSDEAKRNHMATIEDPHEKFLTNTQ